MLSFTKSNLRFNYRICAVFIHQNRVLLHRFPGVDFLTLPGGRCEFIENSKDTIIREMNEELNEEIVVERLLYTVENFFEFNGFKYHELSYIYKTNFKDNCSLLFKDEFLGYESSMELYFKWYDLDEIQNLDIKPTFLKEKLINISDSIEHIIHYE